MSRYIPEEIRQTVATRANFRCEYCQMPEVEAFLRFTSTTLLVSNTVDLPLPKISPTLVPIAIATKGVILLLLFYLTHLLFDFFIHAPIAGKRTFDLKVPSFNPSPMLAWLLLKFWILIC